MIFSHSFPVLATYKYDGLTKTKTYPYLEFDPLVLPEHCFDFEIDPDRGDEGGREGVVCVAEEERGLAHGGVPDDQQLEHVVKVLVCGILLPGLALGCHLETNETKGENI